MGVWEELRIWWTDLPMAMNRAQLMIMYKHIRGPRARTMITGAIMIAGLYNIWKARNYAKFQNHILSVSLLTKGIREQVIYRI